MPAARHFIQKNEYDNDYNDDIEGNNKNMAATLEQRVPRSKSDLKMGSSANFEVEYAKKKSTQGLTNPSKPLKAKSLLNENFALAVRPKTQQKSMAQML